MPARLQQAFVLQAFYLAREASRQIGLRVSGILDEAARHFRSINSCHTTFTTVSRTDYFGDSVYLSVAQSLRQLLPVEVARDA
jgi:hypothetical protein